MNKRYCLNDCPITKLMNKIRWSSIDISGADDLERFKFFKKYPNSKQRNLWLELTDIISKMDIKEKEKFIIETLVWFSNFRLSLSHIAGDLEENSKSYINKHLYLFIDSLFSGD